MKKNFKKKSLIILILLLCFSLVSGIIDFNHIKNEDFDNVCKWPLKSTYLDKNDGNNYNYCIGPLYYIRYKNNTDMTILPIDASEKIDMGIWFLPGITIYE